MTSRDQGKTSALDKVIRVLEAFLQGDSELRLSDIAEITGLTTSTTYVVASSLVDRGYLAQKGKRGKYSLGLRLLQFSEVINADLGIRDIALPYMEALMNEVQENVELMVRAGDEVVTIAKAETDHMLTVGGRWLFRSPLHCATSGKLVLAELSPRELAQLRERLVLTRETPNTIVDWDALDPELEKVRREGVAVDNEETGMGVRGVGAPIRNAVGQLVATVNIVGPTMRMPDDKTERFKQAARDCGLEISRALGYSAPGT